MIISLKEAFALLNKWNEESALLAVAGESPFREMLRGIEDRGVRWSMSQSVRVSRIDMERGFVEFEPIDFERLNVVAAVGLEPTT